MSRRANSEGSIYQRASDGTWVRAVSLEGGKRRRIYGRTQRRCGNLQPHIPIKVTGGRLMERSGSIRPPSRWPLQPHNHLVPTGMAALSPVHQLFIPSGRASTSCSGQHCADAIESAGGGHRPPPPPLPRCYSNHEPPEGQDQ